ncbi:sulfate ABC transporter substrate-binding protein [Nesterenkonia pannonica]|uniref:sulfate ABC transporter substrate-binding protein n=1 Tax=Nesterenkonia pannonica TaxID=1548602 RepID=UPI002164765A|nr:sulfate ABC transporter substrate-binding protein [Nesterenkonia pannonica]
MHVRPKYVQRFRGSCLALSGLTLLSGCADGDVDDQITMVGFAVSAEADTAVADAFAQTPQGQSTTYATSYGASGDQSRAVANGLPGEFVHFSIEPDLTRLEDAGMVSADWDEGPSGGMITESVVVLIVREGNPKGITDWNDLVREDVGVVTPNPGSSGAARWNILAAWASVLQNGGTEADAADYLDRMVSNIEAFPGSGRDATTAFLDGTGDVLLSYENEAILGRQAGENFEYIVPDRNLLIENPAALTEQAPQAAEDLLEFALSPEGQSVYAQYGFRPLRHLADDVDPGEVDGSSDHSDPYPTVETLWTVDEHFGGWDSVVEEFFAEDGTITRAIEQSGIG